MRRWEDCTTTTSSIAFGDSSNTISWGTWLGLDFWSWEVAEEEEPAKPKYKAPRPERRTNKIVQTRTSLPMKQHAKQMFASQRWNR
jgi:hypothetical protein